MACKIILAGTILLIPAIGASAAEDPNTEVAIAVADTASSVTNIYFDGAEPGFSLHDMQEGENRSIVDASGRTILVTRTANGFTIDKEGETIEVPAFDAEHAATLRSGSHGAVFIGRPGKWVTLAAMLRWAWSAAWQRLLPAPWTV